MELTTTSYALLGLLALRPWTTYELAQQAQRSLRLMWPVAERQLYEQPKTLVRHGLASATGQRVGNRPRTVYAITPAGRQALEDWLHETDGHFNVRSDILLRAFFSDQAGKNALHAQVEALAAKVREGRRQQVALYEADRDSPDGFLFPERRHLNGLMARLNLEIAGAVERWAEWVLLETAQWDERLEQPPDTDEFLARVFAIAEPD